MPTIIGGLADDSVSCVSDVINFASLEMGN